MLILASRSPQRRAILEQLGIAFAVRVADVKELADGDPSQVALENAWRKAAAVASDAPGELVVGADTVVALGGRIYDKPESEPQARATLQALGGQTHTVISGLCVIEAGETSNAVTRTAVQFRALDDRLIDWYLSTGEWRDRAGGYAVQGKGAALVSRIEGDYLNVVGLPLTTLLNLRPELLSP